MLQLKKVWSAATRVIGIYLMALFCVAVILNVLWGWPMALHLLQTIFGFCVAGVLSLYATSYPRRDSDSWATVILCGLSALAFALVGFMGLILLVKG